VDATYRADLRELNELNFARFDAKVEQRFAQADAALERRLADLRVEIGRVQTGMVKWMFAFWAPTAITTIGTALGVVSLLLRK
jgi:hypothetical protein